jgi:hypothetical protein
VGRIETVTDVSDQVAAVMSVSGGPPVTVSCSDMCQDIDSGRITLIGATGFVATQQQTLTATQVKLVFWKHFISLR